MHRIPALRPPDNRVFGYLCATYPRKEMEQNKSRKTFLVLAAFSMVITVAFGALGAHALKSVLTVEQLTSFQTGVRYQAWHSLALMLIQYIPSEFLKAGAAKTTSILMAIGILLFSFSIYVLSLRDVWSLGEGISFIGPLTPLGGLFFIAAWAMLGISVFRGKTA